MSGIEILVGTLYVAGTIRGVITTVKEANKFSRWVKKKKIEEEIRGGGDYIITDTCVLDIELWSKIKFKKVDEKILYLSTKEEFDIYLLCKPDIPWKYDKLRENEHTRELIYKEFKSIMKKRNLNYFVIGGSLVKRIASSLDIIKNK